MFPIVIEAIEITTMIFMKAYDKSAFIAINNLYKVAIATTAGTAAATAQAIAVTAEAVGFLAQQIDAIG